MELENSYYKRIIYKKNAFEDLKTYIKLNFNNKNICFVTSKSVPAEEVTKLLNAIFYSSEKICHFVVRNNFSQIETENLKRKLENNGYDLIVVFGGGRICDYVKYLANIFDIPYIICPSVACSLAYFSKYCFAFEESTKTYKCKMPLKVFIQESVIRNSSCITNINGLGFLHSLRAVYVEGLLRNNEKDSYAYMGLEKLFAKLDAEQTNILLCNEDSNLVLMDLLIDFGFFVDQLDINYCLYNSYKVYEKMYGSDNGYAGQKMLLITKVVLSILKKYLELNFFNVIEMPNFKNILEVIEKNNIKGEIIKNYAYFLSVMGKSWVKKEIINNKDEVYNIVCKELFKIKEFNKKVKTVYKRGVEISDSFDDVMRAVSIGLYIYDSAPLIDFVAGSGILNSFVG